MKGGGHREEDDEGDGGYEGGMVSGMEAGLMRIGK